MVRRGEGGGDDYETAALAGGGVWPRRELWFIYIDTSFEKAPLVMWIRVFLRQPGEIRPVPASSRILGL